MIRARARAQLVAGVVILAAIALSDCSRDAWSGAVAAAAAGRAPDAAASHQPAADVRRRLLAAGHRLAGDEGARRALPRGADKRDGPAPNCGKGRLLLMAHPLAQPAEDLVALDRVGARRRPAAAARRPDARMAERALARRSDAAAADVRGHGTSCPLGAAPRRARMSAGIAWEKLAGFDIVTALARDDYRDRARSAGTGSSLVAGSAKAKRSIVAEADFLDVRGPRSRGKAQPRRADCRACFAREIGDSLNNRLIHRPQECIATHCGPCCRCPQKSAQIRLFP